jgi:hypothetical protein
MKARSKYFGVLKVGGVSGISAATVALVIGLIYLAISAMGLVGAGQSDPVGLPVPPAGDLSAASATAETGRPHTGSAQDGEKSGTPGAKTPKAGKKPKPTKKPSAAGRTSKPPAGTPKPGQNQTSDQSQGDSDGPPTVNCPSVRNQLPAVPASVSGQVDQALAELDQQIDAANMGLAFLAAHPVSDPNFIQNTILGPLRDRRISTLDRIATAIDSVTHVKPSLAGLAPCTLNG